MDNDRRKVLAARRTFLEHLRAVVEQSLPANKKAARIETRKGEGFRATSTEDELAYGREVCVLAKEMLERTMPCDIEFAVLVWVGGNEHTDLSTTMLCEETADRLRIGAEGIEECLAELDAVPADVSRN